MRRPTSLTMSPVSSLDELPTLLESCEIMPPECPLAVAPKGVSFISFVGLHPVVSDARPHCWVHLQPCRRRGGATPRGRRRSSDALGACPLGGPLIRPPDLSLFPGYVKNGFWFCAPWWGGCWRPLSFPSPGWLSVLARLSHHRPLACRFPRLRPDRGCQSLPRLGLGGESPRPFLVPGPCREHISVFVPPGGGGVGARGLPPASGV